MRSRSSLAASSERVIVPVSAVLLGNSVVNILSASLTTAVLTAIFGATDTTYTVTSADLGYDLQFCVDPYDDNGFGAEACSSATTSAARIAEWPLPQSWAQTTS